MAKDISDVGDTLGAALGTVAREVVGSVSSNGHGSGKDHEDALTGARGVAAGAALAALPIAGVAAKRLVMRRIAPDGGDGPDAVGTVKKLTQGAKGAVTSGVKEAIGEKIDKVGGAPEMAKEAGKKMLPSMPSIGGEDSDSKGGKGGTPGVGKGRRMPVQQAVDVGVPLAVAYNQWTQFEEWPQFMHRIDRVTQEDDCTVSFRTKVWGMSKESVAQIVEQRPDERIQWSVAEGTSHTGVVTFHELAPNLTRVQVSLDLEPGTWVEKAARGMRYVKRAVRADLARFKSFIEMQEVETGAWRGAIHDGEIVEGHDRKYDRQREYADFDDIHDRESSHRPQGKAQKAKAKKSKAKAKPKAGKARAQRASHKGRKRSGSSSSSKAKRSRR
jgi:hypothetical protein